METAKMPFYSSFIYVGLWTLTAVKMLGLLATAKATAVYNII